MVEREAAVTVIIGAEWPQGDGDRLSVGPGPAWF